MAILSGIVLNVYLLTFLDIDILSDGNKKKILLPVGWRSIYPWDIGSHDNSPVYLSSFGGLLLHGVQRTLNQNNKK